MKTNKAPKDFDIIVPSLEPFEYLDKIETDLGYNLYTDDESLCCEHYENSMKLVLDSDPPLLFDVWCQDIGEYLSHVPTAFDGIAINLTTGCVMMTNEFTASENFEILGREVKRFDNNEYRYREHLENQGLKPFELKF